MDLDAYFARIGHRGSRDADLETLGAILRGQAGRIPFEAIDVLLGVGIDLSPAAIFDKLVRRRRGGYCFEQNGLLRDVLSSLGFEVRQRLARVLWMRPVGDPVPRATHMMLVVRVDGRDYLADTGFGNGTPTAPLDFHTQDAQPTRLETFRLVPTPDGHRLEMQIEARWAPVYEVLSPDAGADALADANLFTSTHPDSRFRRDLMLARATDEARHLLLGNRLATRPAQGRPELTHLDTPDALGEAIEATFGLQVLPAWRPLIEAVARGTERGNRG